MKLGRTILPYIVTVVSICYAFGDHVGVWDTLSGRAGASKGVYRMGSAQGLKDTLLCSPDTEFHAVMGFILSYSENPEIKKLAENRVLPDCMTSLGGGAQIVPVPPEWPQSARLVGHSPFIVMYNAERVASGGYRGKDGKNANALWAARLDDVSGWASQSRTKERFMVTTVLVGFLSLGWVFLKKGRNRTFQEENTRFAQAKVVPLRL